MDDALAFMNGLYGTAVRLTRDGDAARDLVQDTYLKALRAQGALPAGHQPQGLALHHPPQHLAEPAPRRRPGAGRFDSDTVEAAVDAGHPGVVETDDA